MIGNALVVMVVSSAAISVARGRFAVAGDRARLDLETAPRRQMRAATWWAMTVDRPVELWLTLWDVDVTSAGGVVVIEVDDPADGIVRLVPGGRCQTNVLAPTRALPS